MHREGEESKCSEWQERSTKSEMVKGAITHMDSRSSRKYSLVKADSVHLQIFTYACLAEIFMTNLIN